MKKSPKRQAIVVVSDLHCGCKLGLCPPKGVSLDEGGIYTPSKFQNVTWSWWREFWDKWVPQATHGKPYSIVVNGDSVDGVHHNSTSQISHNLIDQQRIAHACLAPEFKKSKCGNYMIRGTEAHVGKSGVDEERLAESLNSVPSKAAQFARYDLWLNLGDHLVHFLHHIGTTSSSAHEASAVNAELTAEFIEACRWGEKNPACIIRSHRHRAIEVRLPTKDGFATASVTAGWQGKSSFAWKIAGARLSPPQFGGLVIQLDSTGQVYTSAFVRSISRDEPE